MYPPFLAHRPILPFCLVTIVGIALAPVLGAGAAKLLWPCVTLILVAALLAGRNPLLRVTLVGVSVMLAVSLIEQRECSRSQARFQPWLPAGGSAVELDFEGSLLAAAEPAGRGERLLIVQGRPTATVGTQPARLQLRVRASAPSATARLDALQAGDKIRVWCRLRRSRPLGNPISRDAKNALRARGLAGYGTIKSARLVELIDSGGPTLRRVVDRLKRESRRRLDRIAAGSAQSRALLGAVLLGDRAALSPGSQRMLREAGLLHLVAISGLHVGLLLMALVRLFRRMRFDPLIVLLPLVIFLYSFCLFVGPRPSVLRAVLAGAVYLFARGIGRQGDPLNSLAGLALLLMLSNTSSLLNPGFQLTFLATAGILLLTPRIVDLLPLPGIPANALALSAAAYLSTAPVLAWHFGRLAPAALLSNLLGVPLTALILAGGYSAILLNDLPLCGEAAAWCALAATRGLFCVARFAESLDGGSFVVSKPALFVIVGYVASLALLGYTGTSTSSPTLLRVMRRLKPALCFAFGLCLLWIHLGPPPPGATRRTEVIVLDVGQGQAILLRAPTGGLFLVDAGGAYNPRFDPGERVVLPSIIASGTKRLEALLISHGHLDHIGGAFAVLRELEVGELWLGSGSHLSSPVQELAALAIKQGTSVRLAEQGTVLIRSGLRLESLGPPRNSSCRTIDDRSLSILAGSEPTRIIIAGDLEDCGEGELLATDRELRAEALVLSHHGSRDGSGAPLLERVRPKLAIASAGQGNPFGHPHHTVVERLRERGIELWSTDRHGQLHLIAGRDGWLVNAFHYPDRNEDK